jgi:L-lactate dehydrogenase complex protein LldG
MAQRGGAMSAREDVLNRVRTAGLPVDEPAACDAVLTAGAAAVAETGTIVLDAGSDQGRRVITLQPGVHVCVVRTDQIVTTIPEALTRLTATPPQTWISGPSVTGDIELSRVEGYPARARHVLIVEAGKEKRGNRQASGTDG